MEGNEGPDAGEFLSAGIDSEEMSELAPNLEDEAGEQAKLEGTRLDVSVALAGEYVFDPLQLGEGEAARDGNLTLLATEDGEYVSYEDLCRQHMEQFLRGVEQFTRETKLAKRVNEWEMQMMPMLEEQERSEQFDMQREKKELVGELKKEGHVMPIRDLAEKRKPHEVSRMFVSLLQMVGIRRESEA